MTAAAAEPLTRVRKSPPSELIKTEGGLSPDLLIFLGALGLAVTTGFGHFCWDWSGWCCFFVNTLALHLVGTVIHDASHNSAHRNRIMNACLGHGSALMLGFTFPVFTRVHLQHHAHVNDPENDPDHFVSTSGPLWGIAARFFYHEVYFFQRRLWRKFELLEWFLSRLIFATVIFVACRYGFMDFIFNYWFAPALVVGWALGLFFDYLPHRPFEERDRWKNARVYPSPLLNLLIMGQNYHLVHHLWPSIPWYKYKPAYEAMKPLLDEKNCDQVMGLLQKRKDFIGFVYDIFLGIRLHHEKPSQVDPQEKKPVTDKLLVTSK